MSYSDTNCGKVNLQWISLRFQIQELQDRVNSLNDSTDFHDPGLNHVPSHPFIAPSSFRMLCRGLTHGTSFVHRKNFFENYLHRMNRQQFALEFNASPTPRFVRKFQLGILPLMQKQLIRRVAWLNNRRIRSWKCISVNSLIHSGTCAACQETFLQIHLCQMNRRHLFLRNVYARSPSGTHGEPVLSSTGKNCSEIWWTKQGDSKLYHPPTRDLPETCRPWIFRLPHKRLIHTFSWLDSRRTTSRSYSSKNSQRLRHSSVGRRVSKQHRVLVLVTFRRGCVGLKMSRWLLLWTISRSRNQFEDIVSPIFRC